MNGMHGTRTSALAIVGLVGLTLAMGCSSGTGPGNGGGGAGSGSVTVSNSLPASNGSVTNLVAVLDVTNPNLYAVHSAGKVGTVDHSVEVYFDPANGAVQSVTHAYQQGGVDAFNACSTAGPACDPAKVSVNQTTKRITFTGLVLPDGIGVTPAQTSTLDGTIDY
jgi:hypothetical protein